VCVEDVANGFGHFEPVGCRPNFTGRGYVLAVTIEGIRRMQARGTHTSANAATAVSRCRQPIPDHLEEGGMSRGGGVISRLMPAAALLPAMRLIDVWWLVGEPEHFGRLAPIVFVFVFAIGTVLFLPGMAWDTGWAI
jgi:hypothetical protein